MYHVFVWPFSRNFLFDRKLKMSESSLSLSRVTGIVVFLVKTIKNKITSAQVKAKLDTLKVIYTKYSKQFK